MAHAAVSNPANAQGVTSEEINSPDVQNFLAASIQKALKPVLALLLVLSQLKSSMVQMKMEEHQAAYSSTKTGVTTQLATATAANLGQGLGTAGGTAYKGAKSKAITDKYGTGLKDIDGKIKSVDEKLAAGTAQDGALVRARPGETAPTPLSAQDQAVLQRQRSTLQSERDEHIKKRDNELDDHKTSTDKMIGNFQLGGTILNSVGEGAGKQAQATAQLNSANADASGGADQTYESIERSVLEAVKAWMQTAGQAFAASSRQTG